jgi:hypothetical protein
VKENRSGEVGRRTCHGHPLQPGNLADQILAQRPGEKAHYSDGNKDDDNDEDYGKRTTEAATLFLLPSH